MKTRTSKILAFSDHNGLFHANFIKKCQESIDEIFHSKGVDQRHEQIGH